MRQKYISFGECMGGNIGLPLSGWLNPKEALICQIDKSKKDQANRFSLTEKTKLSKMKYRFRTGFHIATRQVETGLDKAKAPIQ